MPADATKIRLDGRNGFTLIEMLVVIAVIAALAAIGIPTLDYMRHRGQVAATESLVKDVAMLIATHEDQQLTLPQAAGGFKVYQLWDINGDGLLDGYPPLENPELDPENAYPAAVLADGELYRGFIKEAGPTLPENHVDEQWRVIDSWGHPLRIDYMQGTYGAGGCGVWSVGPDGMSEPLLDSSDDICSWRLGR